MEVRAFFDFDFADGSVVVLSFSTNSYASITEDTGRRERERARAARTQARRSRAAGTRRRRGQPAAIAPVNFEQNVAVGGTGPAPAAPAAPFDPNAETCCIGVACKEPRPDYTWLPCCENNSVCMECIIEHVRQSGSTCPLCRGDLSA